MGILSLIKQSIDLFNTQYLPAKCIYYWQDGGACMAVKIGASYMQGPSDFFRDGSLSEDGYNKAVAIINTGPPQLKPGEILYSTEVELMTDKVLNVTDLFYDVNDHDFQGLSNSRNLFLNFEAQFNGPPIKRRIRKI